MKNQESNQTMSFPEVVRFFSSRKLTNGFLKMVLGATRREKGHALVDAMALRQRMIEIGRKDLFNQLSSEVVTTVNTK